MKRKTISRIFAVLLAALIATGGLSATAFAGGPEYTEPESTGQAESTPEETPEPRVELLTPEGNMTLVDDIKGDVAGDKQFIVVQSRGGNYFYIIIDNAAEGENRVHFLNQVDEADLLSIIDEDLQTVQPTPEPEPEPIPQITEPEPTPLPEPEPEQPKNSNALYGLILFLLVAVLGGGAFLYLKVIKPKQNVKGNTDLDEFDFEEWDEDEPEDESDNRIESADLDSEQEDKEADE